jgi:hypothetical protein
MGSISEWQEVDGGLFGPVPAPAQYGGPSTGNPYEGALGDDPAFDDFSAPPGPAPAAPSRPAAPPSRPPAPPIRPPAPASRPAAPAAGKLPESTLTGMALEGGQLRQASSPAWIRDVRLTGTDLTEASWQDLVVTESVLVGVQARAVEFRRVAFRDCELDGVNFRRAAMSEAIFENCLLREVDFTGAALTRVAFTGSRLSRADFTDVTMNEVDLRGAELGLTIGPQSLRGAIMTPAQLMEMAPLLAASLGVRLAEIHEGQDRGR